MRHLTRTTALNGSLDWPDVGPVFALERVRQSGAKVTVEGVQGITSLTRAEADAARLQGLVRGPGGIENGPRDVRDETRGEDRCRLRQGAGAEVLAVIRNPVVHRLAGTEAPSKAAATRRFASHPEEAVALLRNT